MKHVRISKVESGDSQGQYYFQVIGGNGEPQDTSEPYVSLANAKRGASDLLDRPVDDLIFTLDWAY